MTHFFKVENSFEMTRGDILVRRKSFEGTLEEQRAGCPSYEDGAEQRRMVSLSFEPAAGEEDYLEISVDHQQEELGPCKIDIWSNGPVTFIPPAAAVVTVLFPKDVETLETNTSLRIPSGLPTWKLEIMMPAKTPREDEGSMTNVTVGDAPPGGLG
jgi:hypothetical protein